MNDKGEQFYEYLKSSNIDVPESYKEFQSSMQDKNTASQFYSFVKSQKIDVPNTPEEFQSVFSSSVEGEPVNFTKGSVELQSQPTEPSKQNGIPFIDNTPEYLKSTESISKEQNKKPKDSDLYSWDDGNKKPTQVISEKQAEKDKLGVKLNFEDLVRKKLQEIPEQDKMLEDEVNKASDALLVNEKAKIDADIASQNDSQNFKTDFDKGLDSIINNAFPMMMGDSSFNQKMRFDLLNDPERLSRYRQDKTIDNEESFLIQSEYLRNKITQEASELQSIEKPTDFLSYIEIEKKKTNFINDYAKFVNLQTENKPIIDKIREDQEIIDELNTGGVLNFSKDLAFRALNSLNNVATDLITLPATLASSFEDITGRGDLYTISDRILDYADKTYKDKLLVSERQFYNEQTGEYDLGGAFLGAADQVGILAALALGNVYAGRAALASTEGSLLTSFAKDALVSSSQNVYTVAGGYAASLESNRRDAKEMNLSGSDAFAYTQFMSLLEGATELIMPDNKIFSKEIKDIALKTFASNLSRGNRFAAKEALKSIGEIVGKENLEEILVLAGKTFQTGAIAIQNEDVEVYLPTLGELINTVATTTIASGTIPTITSLNKRKQIENQMILKASRDLNGTKQVLDQFVKKGIVKKEDANAFLNKVNKSFEAVSEIPSSFTEEEASTTLDQAIRLTELRAEAKNKKGVAKEQIDEEIKSLEEEIRIKSQEVKIKETENKDNTGLKPSDQEADLTSETVLENKAVFNEVSITISSGESVNEVKLDNALNEAYDALNQLDGVNTQEAEIMRELIEDEIQKLENYDNITTTETRKVAEERTRTVSKKTPRKTIPRKEKNFVGKKVKYTDGKGGGASGTISVTQTPDGREYYVLESANPTVVEGDERKVSQTDTLQQKVVLGETSKAFNDGVVNLDKEGNPTSVTFKTKEGNQITIKSPEIAVAVSEEKVIQQQFDEETFNETYLEFVGEEQVEVKKAPSEKKVAVNTKPKSEPKQASKTDKEKLREKFGTTSPKFKKGEQGDTIDTSNKEEVQDEMDNLPEEVANFDAPSNLTTNEKINIGSLVQRFGNKLKSLWNGGVIKNISDFNGIPFIFTISDQLSSGAKENPLTGNTIDLNGGLGFALTEGNENNAWANTAEDKAAEMLNNAQEVYRNNTELFDRLWKEKNLPYGHIPVAIVKMGQESILTNEALFRLAADNIKTHFSEEERRNSLIGLKEDIKDFIYSTSSIITKENKNRKKKGLKPLTKSEELDLRNKVYSENNVIQFIKDNNFTTIDELLDNLNKLSPIGDRRQVSDLLFTGGVGKDTDPTKGRPSKKSAFALLGNKGKEYNKYIHTQTLNNILKEEATNNIPEEHIIGITSIDVLNPQLTKPNHRNYPDGVKGQMLGVLESPVHVADVFPEVYARIFAMNKPAVGGVMPSVRKVVGQAVAASGQIAAIKALRGAKINDKLSDLNKLLGLLKLSFPSVTVVDTKKEFDKALDSPNVKKFVKDGEVVYGFTSDGRVYLNPDKLSLNTPLHEFSHVWMSFLEENNPELLEKGYKLLEGTELLKRKIEEFGDTILARQEAMAEAIANRGETIIEAGKNSKFKNWLNAVFSYLKSKVNGFEGMSPKEIQNMSLEDFVDNSLAAILSGKEITEKQIKSVGVKFSKGKPSIQNIIDFAKEEGISNKDLIEFLKEEGYSDSAINKAFPKSKAAPTSVIEKDAVNVKLIKNLKNKISKLTDNNEARKVVAAELRVLLKDSSLSQFSKTTVNKVITNLKNTTVGNMQKMLDNVGDAIANDETRVARNNRYKARANAIKNIAKIGALKELQNSLITAIRIDPKYLSDDALARYDSIISDLLNVNKKYDNSTREEFSKNINYIITSYSRDSVKANNIATLINDLIDPSKSIRSNLAKMLKDDILTKEEHDIITRFSVILNESSIVDPMEGYTDEELAEYKSMIESENRKVIESDFIEAMAKAQSSFISLMSGEKVYVDKANKITVEDLRDLSVRDAKLTVRGIEMMRAGFVTPSLVQGIIKIDGHRAANKVPLLEIKESGVIDKVYSRIKTGATNTFKSRKNKSTAVADRISASPLKNLEQLFDVEKEMKDGAKKFKATSLYESLFRPSSVALSKAQDDLKVAETNLKAANNLLSFNQNERFIQKAKIMIYQIQREFDSNKGNKEVNPAIDWINASIKDKDTLLSDKEIKALEKIRDEFLVDGQIDAKSIFDSLTEKEVKALRLIDKVYNSIQDKATVDATAQGLPFILRENYVHLPKSSKQTDQVSDDFNDLFETFKNPSIKSKALIQRTGKTHSVSFDPVSNAYAASRKAINSYYMYPVVKSAKVSFSSLSKKAETKFSKDLVSSLEDVYDTIIRNEFQANVRNSAVIEKGLAWFGKAGYLSQLAGPVKSVVELTTNATHAMFLNPAAFVNGEKIMFSESSEIIDAALRFTNTTQGSRITGNADLESSSSVESRLFEKSKLFSNEEMTSEFSANAKTVFAAAKIPFDFAIKFNEGLISKPDTLIARPLFIGVFSQEFKKLTGQKLNWEKMANDEAYRERFAEAIDQSSAAADSAVIDNAASNNPFDSIPKNLADPDASMIKRAYQTMNVYMSRFRIFEYYSALKGVQNLFGKGEITRMQGAMLLTGTVVRMSMYKMAMETVFSLIFSMLGIDDDEDEINPSTDITRNILGGIATLAFGRNLGNFAQMPVNYGIEWLNELYGEGITREGEYNPYKDSVVFSKIALNPDPQDNAFLNLIVSSLGSFTPVVKTALRASELSTRVQTGKNEETIQKNKDELFERIPFELAGETGVIPGYKDLRKIYLKYLFQGINDAKKEKTTSSERPQRSERAERPERAERADRPSR